MNAFFMVALILMGAGALMMGMMVLRGANEKSKIGRRFSGDANALIESRWKQYVVGSWKDPEVIKQYLEKDSELSRALWQAGIRGPNERTLYFLFSVALPAVLILLTISYHFISAEGLNRPLLTVIALAIVGVLAPKRIISLVASLRCERIINEVPVYIQILKILFDAGLSIEQALRVVATEARLALPEISKELDIVLRRTSGGLDLAQELDQNAFMLGIEEYTDVVSILKQMLRQGGSARSSLSKLSELVEDRRMTNLKEKVSKLSAKMTMVMIVFMFPALIILIAAPGFMAISKAFGNL